MGVQKLKSDYPNKEILETRFYEGWNTAQQLCITVHIHLRGCRRAILGEAESRGYLYERGRMIIFGRPGGSAELTSRREMREERKRIKEETLRKALKRAEKNLLKLRS